jgi:hypothetical protein
MDVLNRLLATRWSVFLWGPPGIGKSSVVRQLAEKRSMPLIDIRAALLDPTDLRGIPAVDGGRAKWYPPSFLPGPEKEPGILFFDELSAAPTLVQASLYQLTLDRRVGEYELPDGWRIIAAGNRAEDASIAFRMPAALANRFIHIDFEVDFADWKQWALTNGMHPLVIGFLTMKPGLLFAMEGADRAFPSPRSWEILSDAIKTIGEPLDAEDVSLGIVGEGATIEFLSYCRQRLSAEELEAILANPTTHPLPTSLGEIYTLVTYIAAHGKSKKITDAAGALLSRLEPEFAVLLTRDILHVNSHFVRNADYKKFIKQHADLIA